MLSDDAMRSNYDHGGRDGVEGAPKMDSSALFAMIFGSEKFEPLVGEWGGDGGERECVCVCVSG